MLSTLVMVDRLKEKPLFTINQFCLLTGLPKRYAAVRLNRMVKNGVIFRIEKGKYTAHDDPLLFSSHLIQPSYLTLWSALAFHGFTTQLPREVFVAARARPRKLMFGKTSIVFIRAEPWGFQKTAYRGMDVFIAEPEKLLIDIVATGLVPLSETEELFMAIDAKKTAAYALKVGNKALLRRIGFLLEEHGNAAEELFSHRDGNYVALVRGGKRKGHINRKWRIIDNR